jgi:hypothetical protein
MWITVYPKGAFKTVRQKFDDLAKQGLLVKQVSPRKDMEVYQKPAEKEWYVEDYYVLTGFKDLEGKPLLLVAVHMA